MKKPKPVLELIGKHDCVVAYFAGHSHGGGYIQRNGVHHITVAGMVEAPVKNAYAIITIYADKLEEIGFGKEPSREIPIPALNN